MIPRQLSTLDELIINLDTGLRTLAGQPAITERINPADKIENKDLSDTEKKHAAGLMRVNHAGEVCAQALYQGQALTARNPEVKRQMERSAQEENDHLDWCEHRLKELDSRTSLLNPLWYMGSLSIGALAGLAGDKWSLGFVAETEKQVEKHLDGHLGSLPTHDQKSRVIVEQMKQDEIDHGNKARDAGGVDLPTPIKALMGLTSKILTKTAYRI